MSHYDECRKEYPQQKAYDMPMGNAKSNYDGALVAEQPPTPRLQQSLNSLYALTEWQLKTLSGIEDKLNVLHCVPCGPLSNTPEQPPSGDFVSALDSELAKLHRICERWERVFTQLSQTI